MLTFQQIIATLNTFWETRGCVIQLGHDLETGAGTFNPITFLGCLGKQPCFAAYVEPSRRPTVGRYGENPNRVQRFHQYQVIMKPSPSDIQQSYLQSLEAIGLNLKEHDIRFVHDDWESPTLGAHGLGWEVWVDGMEVTQFTYFQGVANLQLSPITVELTYGLERLAMYLQNVDNIFDVKWNEKFTLRDLMLRSEVEWSDYNFTAASTKMWHDHFEDYAQEAKALVARDLPLPAYDFVIKASHAFNILDARGVISVTERTGYIARIRELSREVAHAYVDKEDIPLPEKASPPKLAPLPASFSAETKKDFLFEIGSEQLPATFVPIGMKGLRRHLEKILRESGLTFDSIDLYGTPRRLSAIVRNLNEATAKVTTERKGPAIASAFDPSGNPTKQGAGFLRSLDCEEATLEAVRSGKFPNLSVQEDYLYAQVTKGGESVYEILSVALPKLIQNLEFPKRMRWGTLDVTYARPIHWIVALYGKEVIPFAFGDVISSNFTFGHAQRKPEKITLAQANDYVEELRKGFVLVDVQERRELIESQVKTIEAELGATTLETERVLKEVVHLTEWPELAHATFDKRFLKVPAEVLISEMVEHQRYFPLAGPNGELVNSFIITADNKVTDLIIRGNQKVLSARLSDGVFLYDQDLKTPLEEFNKKLEKMTFQKELGSMLEKVGRITSHAEKLNSLLGLADQKMVARAAMLCKADLASELVGEFPELQGTIGKYYAIAEGEKEEVALAIEEHWLPISDKGPLPKSPIGILLSLSDKLDNLLCYYKVGLKPTSSSDPYALRRQTIGILKILIENNLSLDLVTLLRSCDPESPIDEIMQFITSRAKGVFEELGYSKDAIEASLAGMIHDPCDQLAKVRALDTFRKSDSFEKLFEVFKRAKGQIGKQTTLPFDPALALEPAEKQLVATLDALSSNWESLLNAHDYEGAFNALATLQLPLAELFDNVKILAEDEKLKNNRIALLQKVFALFEELLDFNRMNLSH